MKTVRQPAVAGTFYTDNPIALGREIDEMYSKVKVAPRKGSVLALIVPHAGYFYSGMTAAHAYKTLQHSSFDTVVIISPSHQEYFRGISIYNGDAYSTPLGEIEIDSELRESISSEEKLIIVSNIGHRSEHAIEVQLPFLQKALKDFKILPIVIGDQQRKLCFHLSSKLAKVLHGKNSLLVASSDLSHYHPASEADKLDKIVIDNVREFDYEQLMENLESKRVEACGGGPVVAVLAAAKQLGANYIEILHHCNSGDITGDRDAVVGYLSAAALRIN